MTLYITLISQKENSINIQYIARSFTEKPTINKQEITIYETFC